MGTGLIGASFAKAAAKHRLFSEIVGHDIDRRRAELAHRMGIIERVVGRVPDNAAAVLLAMPGGSVASWVCELADHPGVVFDVASVKQPIVEAVRGRLRHLPPRFVPSHPICGSDRSGPEAAQEDLFRDQTVALTPEPETDPLAVGAVRVMWHSLGARIRILSVVEHDRILALTSHLPHLLSFAYVNQIDPEMLTFAAGGFRDFTRIAASNAALWEQIFRLNKKPLLDALGAFRERIGELATAIESEDTGTVCDVLEAAAARRREFDGA